MRTMLSDGLAAIGLRAACIPQRSIFIRLP
jgi:hypothetical protein